MNPYIRHVKHPELIQFYHSFEWPKPGYVTFFTRVVRYGYPKDEAISTDFKKRNYITDNPQYKDGRICTKCNIYKPRSDFSKDLASKTKHTTKCKVCANIVYAEYRKSWLYERDREYKKKIRTLYMWELVYFDDYHNTLATAGQLEYREVIDKKPRQWYKIKSTVTWHYKSLDTSNTKQKFYRVNDLYPK